MCGARHGPKNAHNIQSPLQCHQNIKHSLAKKKAMASSSISSLMMIATTTCCALLSCGSLFFSFAYTAVSAYQFSSRHIHHQLLSTHQRYNNNNHCLISSASYRGQQAAAYSLQQHHLMMDKTSNMSSSLKTMQKSDKNTPHDNYSN